MEPWRRSGSVPAMTAEEDLARNIRVLRQARGWSQERLADEAAVNRGHVSDLENAKYSARLDRIARIARAFGVAVHVLLDPATASIVSPAQNGSEPGA